MSDHLRRLSGTVAAGAVLTVVLAACGSSGAGPAGAGPSTHAPAAAAAKVATVSITAAKGCSTNATTFAAGGLTFKVENVDATAVSEVELLSGERIVGEKENIPPGFGGEFAVNVAAGDYTLYCPGANPEKSTLTVTGKSSGPSDQDVAQLLHTATTDYGKYVDAQVAELLTAVRTLDKTLHATSLTAAQAAYMKARPYYEKIEPVAESFVIGKNNLDSDIDARHGDVPESKWEGFHRIEMLLFEDRTLRGTGAYGDKLVADVELLKSKTAGLTYQPTELANGAQELMDEVASSKITGEEERYSHIDLLDFANNDEGAEQAFAQLQPALRKIDPALSKQVSGAFARLDDLVNTYRTGANPSGFVLYTSLTKSDTRALAAAVKDVSEPLSQVASKVATA